MANTDQECFVYVVLPGQTHFVTAGRFAQRLRAEQFQTARVGEFFGALRDALPDFWAVSEQDCDRLEGSFLYRGLFL